MARHNFGGGTSDWAFTFGSGGVVTQASGAVLTFWDSITGGNQYGRAPLPGGIDDGTGLLDSTGLPISTVTCDANGEIPDALQGPDGVYKMAADASGNGTGPRRWIFANDMGDDLNALLAETAGLPALEAAPDYVYYNPVTASYPARPAVTSVVWWVGPVQPPVGGSGATGSDIWLNTTGATPPGGVSSVTAADASVVVGGSGAAPTVATASLDTIAAVHPPVSDWSNNGAKITNVAAGVASTDVATVGQLSGGGGGGAALTPTAVKTSAYTATAGDLVLVSTASAAVTITLPGSQPDKTMIGVKMTAQGAGRAVTAVAAGSDRFNVSGGAASLTLSRVFQTVILQYESSAGLWLITGTDPAITLDATGADIQPAGVQAAGGTGLPADAGHVHPATQWIPSDNALLAANFAAPLAAGTAIVIAGNLYLLKIPVRAPFTATNLFLSCSTQGAGTSTGSFCGLWNSSGTLLTGSADIGSQFTTTGPKTLPFTAAQTLTPGGTGGFIWAGFVFNGLSTMPVLRGLSSAGSAGVIALNLNLATSVLACCSNGTAVTSLGNITPSSNQAGGNSTAYFAGIT